MNKQGETQEEKKARVIARMRQDGARTGKGFRTGNKSSKGFKSPVKKSKFSQARIDACYDEEVNFYEDSNFNIEQLESMMNEDKTVTYRCLDKNLNLKEGDKVVTTAKELSGTMLTAWQDTLRNKTLMKLFKEEEARQAEAKEAALKEEVATEEAAEKDAAKA